MNQVENDSVVIDDDADVADLQREPFSTTSVVDEPLEGEGECPTTRMNDNVGPTRISHGVDV